MRISGTITDNDGGLIGFHLEWGTPNCRATDEFIYQMTADPIDPRYAPIHAMLGAMARAAIGETSEPAPTS